MSEDIRTIEHRGYKVGQVPWNYEVAVFSPAGNMVLRGEQNRMLSDDELKEIVDKYIAGRR